MNTTDFKKVREVANELTYLASVSKINNGSYFDIAHEKFYRAVDSVKYNATGLAQKVAETVSGIDTKGYTVGRISEKQAWVIATAIVENNLYTFDKIEEVEEDEEIEENEAVEATEEEIEEVINDVEILKVGDEVEHDRFEEGEVIAITEDKITVLFDGVGERTFAKKFIKLRKI